MGSLGALVSGLPQYLQESFGWQPVASYKPLFALTIIFSIILIFAYSTINEQHRPRKREKRQEERARSGFVTKIALLGMVDNLGAGLVGPLISTGSFAAGVELKSLGFMFFLSYFFAALSFLAAPVLARLPRRGKNHGLFPRACLFDLSGASLGAEFFDRRDNDRRPLFSGLHGQSLEKLLHHGIVRPEDRGAAAGLPLSRHVPVAVSPTLSAYLMQSFSLNVPIFIGGFLQLFHDCVFYLLFRNVRPPEEEVARG